MVCAFGLRSDDGMSLYDVGGFFVELAGGGGWDCGCHNIPTLLDFVEVGIMLYSGSAICISLYYDWLEV